MSLYVDIAEGFGHVGRESLEQNLPRSLAENNNRFHETGDPQYAKQVIVLSQIALALRKPGLALAAGVESGALAEEISRRAAKAKMTTAAYAKKNGLDVASFKRPRRKARVAANSSKAVSARKRKR
jgi:hypothetical protein